MHVCVLRLGSRGTGQLLSFQLSTMCNGFPRPALSPPETKLPALDTKFSDHEGILILQLFKFFDLLSQKQYPVGEMKNGRVRRVGVGRATTRSRKAGGSLTSAPAVWLGFQRL